MSNSAIGQLYKRIIDHVVDASRADFEENGVANRTVQTFQDTWQGHLSSRKTAHFPWDPTPTPASDAPETSTVSNRNPPSAGTNVSPQATSNHAGNGIHIKQEPGQNTDSNPMSLPPATGFANAQERAEHLVQQRRMGGVNPLQGSPISLPGQQGQSAYGGMSYPNQPPYPQHQQQSQQMRPQWAPQPPRDIKQFPPQHQFPDVKQQTPHIKQELNQTDGAGDDRDPQAQWAAVMGHQRELKTDDQKVRQADGMLKRHVSAQMRRLEGGGVLVPIDQRYSVAERQGLPSQSHLGPVLAPDNVKYESGVDTVARFDGGDEDLEDEKDKDAINSDLDDPEEEVDDGTVGEEYEGDTIICLYDKVQRVKNKWKCTLKDGVVNADGKDYVFHKANGEFEW